MTVVDEYLAKLDIPQKAELVKICQIVKQLAPDSQDVITYAMPGFKYRGKYLVSFGVFKDHMSIFPGAGAIAANTELLKQFRVSKGTIQFTLENPIPVKTLKKIIKHRIKEINDGK